MTLLLKRLLGLVVFIAILAYLFAPLFVPGWRNGRYDLAAMVIIFTSVSAWIIGMRMRRKIERDLGREATDADLTSIDTWMKVEEVEQRHEKNRPLGPGGYAVGARLTNAP